MVPHQNHLPSEHALYLIDAIGPFFHSYEKFKINWSKIPWNRLEALDAQALDAFFNEVRSDMRTFCRAVAEIGYNGVTLDDVPHLADHVFLEANVRERMALYREAFRGLFREIRAEGLQVFLTMDVMTFTPALDEKIGKRESTIRSFVCELLDQFFEDFPEVAGVVIRIGESDGMDVKETFRSRLTLKHPRMVNRFLKAVLPVFEKHRRRCIFRTWTVGAHAVGDLIWHDATLLKTVEGIESPALVLSMKYGESDFFRYLSLNRNFFITQLPTIVELQTRREYEGCGEYPSFIGHDYEQLALELKDAPNLIGISVWCQTGGWTPFRRLAFIREGSLWTEINTFVTLRLFKHGELVEEALAQWPNVSNPSALSELLRLSEEVVITLLYLPDFARSRLYFRRIRVPPLVGVYWHHIFVAHSLKKFLKHFVEDGEACIRSGYAALEKIRRMRQLAEQCALPEEDIEYMEYTFGLIALAREYYFRPFDEVIHKRLKKAKKRYKKRYPKGTRFRYTVRYDFRPFKLKAKYIGFVIRYLARRESRYRAIDRIIGMRLLSIVYFTLKRSRPKLAPKLVRKSAMGLDAVFK